MILTESELRESGPWENLIIRTLWLENTNIARLELATVIWALESFIHDQTSLTEVDVTVYTDCKMIHDLPGRRQKLEANNFKSRKTGLALPNEDLFHKFFSLSDRLAYSVIWLKGHTPVKQRTDFQQVFSRLDQAIRQELRLYLKKNAPKP